MTVTIILIIITALVSVQAFSRPALFEQLKHHPYTEVRNREWYRLLSSGFIHGGWLHLLINMFVLYMFGDDIERVFRTIWGPVLGSTLFMVMYLLAIIAGDMPSLIKFKDNPAYASIGASGAVSAVVFIYILFYPWNILWLYGIIPFPAVIGGIGYLIYSSWASRHQSDRIDHLAHFYGALFGVVFMIVLKPQMIAYFLDKVSHLPF